MSLGTSRKNRLPYWNLLFLALVLSGGGFFWHSTQQKQLLNQVDSQLLSTARYIDFFYDKIPEKISAKSFICESISEIHSPPAVTSSLSIYSSQGELLCSSTEFSRNNQMSSRNTIQLTGSFNLKTVADSQGVVRSLTYPIKKEGSLSFYLSINSKLDQLKQQSNIFTIVFFLLSTFILTIFALLQRKWKNQNQVAIRQLTKIINETSRETLPATFTVAETADLEVKKLADSYNDMMMRRSNNLRRARQFAADVTHELRTPLTILRGETELALRNGRDHKQLRQVLISNLEEISRMSYLIEDLLLLSKGDLGEIPLKMETQNLNELIVELHHQAQLLATTKNIKVELLCPSEKIVLQADSLRLRQVFLNLLTNAIKYTPENGHVTIELKENKGHAEIAIIDTGIGMDSNHLELIFDRFYRVNKTGNRNDGGSGLGLAIVKWIVDAHRGSIQVNSTAGQGSKFTVILPLPHNKPTPESATS